MNWISLSQNPLSISNMYESVPDLVQVEVMEIGITHGQSLMLRVDLPVFPSKPPSKWRPEFNAAQVTLKFELEKFGQMVGWPVHNFTDFYFEKKDAGVIYVLAGSEGFKLDFHAFAFRIDGISGYSKVSCR